MKLRQITSKRVSNTYFSSRAFFKADISNNRKVTIPKVERRILSIEEGDTVNLVAVSPDEGTKPIYAEDVNVTSHGEITIPKKGVEKSKEIISLQSIREVIDVDIDKLQIILSKDSSVQGLIDSRVVPNKDFLFNTAIFKTTLIDTSRESATLQFTIPKKERNIVGINPGDKINAVMIDNSKLLFNRRNILRLDVREGSYVTVPAARVRIGNLHPGANIQIVAQPVD